MNQKRKNEIWLLLKHSSNEDCRHYMVDDHTICFVRPQAISRNRVITKGVYHNTDGEVYESCSPFDWFSTPPPRAIICDALAYDGNILQYLLDDPTEEEQIVAVKQHGYAIRFIEYPSENVQIAAIKQYKYSIDYIKNPCDKAKRLAYYMGKEYL